MVSDGLDRAQYLVLLIRAAETTPHWALAKCPTNVYAEIKARASGRKSVSPGLWLELLFDTNRTTAGGKQPEAQPD